MDISASTALVTGANRGFGKALAAELISRGARVYAGARDPGSVSLPGAIPVALDITDPASVAAAASAAADVTLLVNNAGVGTGASLLDGDLEKIRLEMDTHFFGTLVVTRAFAPEDRRERRRLHPERPVRPVLGQFPGRRRVLRGQVRRVVADQRAAPGTRPAGHPGQRAARRLHGH